MATNPKTWGYVLLGPGRPSLAKQREVLAAFDVSADEFGAWFSDKIERGKPGPGSGQGQLAGRNDLLMAVLPGDRVVAATPYCLGVSSDDAAWFIGALARAKVRLTVNGDLHDIEPGADASALVAEVRRAQSRSNTAQHRAGKTKRS